MLCPCPQLIRYLSDVQRFITYKQIVSVSHEVNSRNVQHINSKPFPRRTRDISLSELTRQRDTHQPRTQAARPQWYETTLC